MPNFSREYHNFLTEKPLYFSRSIIFLENRQHFPGVSFFPRTDHIIQQSPGNKSYRVFQEKGTSRTDISYFLAGGCSCRRSSFLMLMITLSRPILHNFGLFCNLLEAFYKKYNFIKSTFLRLQRRLSFFEPNLCSDLKIRDFQVAGNHQVEVQSIN